MIEDGQERGTFPEVNDLGAMKGFSPATIELLERAQRAIDEAEKLCSEHERLAIIARPPRHVVEASQLRSQTAK